MLKREDLERIMCVRADMGVAPKDLYPNYPDPALLAAAPKLALACLRLREYVLGVYDGNLPRAADTGNALRIIDAALAAAGVEEG